MNTSRPSRRRFLQQAAVAGGVAGPLSWVGGKARAQQSQSRPKMAAIGVGGSRGRWAQGTGDSLWASEFADIAAVCDADMLHCHEFNEKLNEKWPDQKVELAKYTDYRKLLDEVKPEVVVIATPDHWHIPISMAALAASCHVYCEKPLTLTIAEGELIRHAVAKAGRVFQVGTQQRSQWGMRFLQAVAMVRLGYLGDVKQVHVAIEGGPNDDPYGTAQPPADLDWNLWVGPAQQTDYSSERQRFFRWYYDYSGGKLTDWGAHHIDISLWALGKENTGPVSVGGTGQFTSLVPEGFNWQAYFNGDATLPNGNMTPTQFSLSLEFADGVKLGVHDRYVEEEPRTRMRNGILFEGSKGRMMVNRNRTTGRPYEELTDADREELLVEMQRLYKGKTPEENHMKNFFQCIDDVSEPVSDVESHVRTMECCHMSNVALMLGRDLKWDPDVRSFVGDEQANALMTRPRRAGFGLSDTT